MKLVSNQIIQPRGSCEVQDEEKQLVDEYSGSKGGVVLQ